ncbi:quinolinate synthase NadA [Alkalihalobacillus hemicellulosilyticus]|uniref:Quinolinate synthase n=1 Tax=Halalkalibacter hemicellulosilyticusJCM 9152 TaxID=1236971 RepID=W4QEQ3_9BACI|nr:quinolinate synthase NadA [Halalkalibacter hemicellulosilyticus]GAE30402.1 quinolinate synthetase [Halalkalibacter hemicellulosilyticusJCM 9152]
MSILEQIRKMDRVPEHYRELALDEKRERIWAIKRRLGKRLFIPGHHYQRDEVIEFADATGDSLQLAQLSQDNKDAEYVVFCGVHFMAETADMLTTDDQHVILPDLKAGCSMADMADIDQTEYAWTVLQDMFNDTILPLTYVNSTAAIKAFCGRYGGATVTSSNAKKMVEWAFTQKERLLFLPDQHLGRNTAYDLGIGLDEMAVWDPINRKLEFEGDFERVKVILWKGHCSVHEKFTVPQIEQFRRDSPDTTIIVHPECPYEVVQAADLNGSTHYIIETIRKAKPGTTWAVGTEMNLVNRLAQQFPDKKIVSLNPTMCPCLTMNRIDIDHLLWSLEELENGNLHYPITVDADTTKEARLALERMLDRK